MAWYDSAVFYQIQPLSLCGCEQESADTKGSHFAELAQWAGHARKIGCNAIYIGTVFKTDTHGNGITDYYKIDSRLGTNEDFKKWVATCHDMGMRVVVDSVFNHVGRGFFAFENLKKNGKKSPYRDWFSNVNFSGDNTYGDGFSYESWGGYQRLVKLNLLDPWLHDYHFDTVRFWISEFDIDGIRIGAIDEMDYDFIKDLRKTAQSAKFDFWLMGELTDGEYMRWVNDRLLHCAANNELQKKLIMAHNNGYYPLVARSIRETNEQCPYTKLYTFVDSPDVSHIYEKLNKKEHRHLITLLQYTVYGIPALYCGSEFSDNVPRDSGQEEGTAPLLKLSSHKDAYMGDEATHLHCLLSRANQQFPELFFGHYQEVMVSEKQFLYARILRKKALLVALNCDDSPVKFEVPLMGHVTKAVNVLEADIDWEAQPGKSLNLSVCGELPVRNNRLLLTLPANSGYLIRLMGD
ncbi:MAG: glycosidase [Eubacterium sp.]|nr:glycosidase [Eubacterium sp.]